MKATYKKTCLIIAILALLTTPAWAEVFRVDKTATGMPVDGSTWGRAYTSIAAAVAAVDSSDDQIWVLADTYTLTAEISISQVMTIYGGFTTAMTQASQRNWSANPTIISGNSSVSCFSITANATIEGFTIRDGKADTLGSGGGGMRIASCDPTVRNCFFYSNKAWDDDEFAQEDYKGGAVMLTLSSATFENCVFYNNYSESDGGAVAYYQDSSTQGSDSTTFTNCTFYGNTAFDYGGAVMLEALEDWSTVNIYPKF